MIFSAWRSLPALTLKYTLLRTEQPQLPRTIDIAHTWIPVYSIGLLHNTVFCGETKAHTWEMWSRPTVLQLTVILYVSITSQYCVRGGTSHTHSQQECVLFRTYHLYGSRYNVLCLCTYPYRLKPKLFAFPNTCGKRGRKSYCRRCFGGHPPAPPS